MNHKFDELTKNMARTVTRRGAMKKFGVGLAGVVLASLGLANKAEAGQGFPAGHKCSNTGQCQEGLICCKSSGIPGLFINRGHCTYPDSCGT